MMEALVERIFPNRRAVDFIICGTQKGGTTALDTYLREHPLVCMARKKEVHFFDTDKLFSGSEPDYSGYHAYFRPADEQQYLGEATPIYMYWQEAPKRIWRYRPDIKLVVLLRNPIERAYSHWNMEHSRGNDPLPFWDAIQNEQARCREALPQQHRVFSYVDRGFYLEQLRRLWRYFPRDRVLVMKNEYLREDPDHALGDLCDFLELERLKQVAPRNVHSRPYPAQMTNYERGYLRSLYEYEIKGIEKALSWDCSDWH